MNDPDEPYKKIILSIGSNLGDRKYQLQKAIKLIRDTNIINIEKISSIYETEPVGITGIPNFYNIAVIGNTLYKPDILLYLIKTIEYYLGRKKRPKWHQREIDIDIIDYHHEIIKKSKLEVPHSEMHKRKFVLIPLIEIYPEYYHVSLNMSIDDLIMECKDNTNVIRLDWSNL
ncbi:2-amino-4-hydroxy-6-hydroxymethyldihydropteridine diphosphokinase [Candidatus Kapaibacterium sp.]